MRPPAFLRRLGAPADPYWRSVSDALAREFAPTERAPVTAQGAEVTAPGLGAKPSDVSFHATPNSPEAQRNHG